MNLDPQSEISISIFGHDYFPLEVGFNMMFGGGDYYSANGVLVMKDQNTAEKLMSMYIYLKYIHIEWCWNYSRNWFISKSINVYLLWFEY